MGIASGAADLLLRSSNKIKFRGKLLQLGNQKILCSKNKFIKLKYRYHKEKIKFDAEKKFDSDLFFKILSEKSLSFHLLSSSEYLCNDSE